MLSKRSVASQPQRKNSGEEEKLDIDPELTQIFVDSLLQNPKRKSQFDENDGKINLKPKTHSFKVSIPKVTEDNRMSNERGTSNAGNLAMELNGPNFQRQSVKVINRGLIYGIIIYLVI